MYFIFRPRQMLHYSIINYTVLYFIFTLNLCILCHTVANSSDLLSSRSNESLSNEIKIEQFKREDKKQINIESENKSRSTDLSENKVVSPGLNNVTVHNKTPIIEDQFNSTTANLPTWMNIDENAFKRTGIVALGFMSIVLIFFVVKAVR